MPSRPAVNPGPWRDFAVLGLNQVRKVTPEELLEALNAARPHFHTRRTNRRALYRFCIEHDLLPPGGVAQTTFYRFPREYDLLASHGNDHKQRLAFSMKYANQLWQVDVRRFA